MDNQAKIKELEKELAAAIQIIKHLEKCGLSAKSSDKIKEMEKELSAAKKENEELRHLHSEDVHRLCVISDPKQGTLFHCKKGHDHFMFDCEGCQYELEEWIDPVKEQSRRAGFLEAVDTLEKWQGTVEFPIRNLRDKLSQMKEKVK